LAERRTRRRFTATFKAQAVKRVLDGRSISEVATELGLSTGQLSTWRLEHLAAGSVQALAQRKTDEAELERQAVAAAFEVDLRAEPAAGAAKRLICCPLLRRPPRYARTVVLSDIGISAAL
jgi:transposase-like protein